MKKTLNLGLVGYKFMGKAHSNAYRQIGRFFSGDADLQMKVLCGRDAEWLSDAAKNLGWQETETDWKKLVSRPDVDVIDITTPSNAHKDIAVEAVKNGKHIFCEKPLALTLADAREMRDEAVKAGVKHQIGFNYRFAPALVLAKKMIDEGKLGKIFHFRGMYLQDWIIDPEFPLVWRLDKNVCGSGSLGDLGAHVIDLARYLVGDFKTVTGMAKTFVPERPLVEKMEGLSGKAAADAPRGKVEVDDATCFVAEFECGALGVFEATRFSMGYKNALSFEICGEKGTISFELERINELKYFSAEDEEGLQGHRLIQVSEGMHPYWAHWWPAGHVIGYEHTFIHELYEFTEAIVLDKKTSPDFSDGVACSQILEAVELSCQRKAYVDVASL